MPAPIAFEIDPDIRRAETLPAEVYTSGEFHEWALDHIFARSWQFIGDDTLVKVPQACHPFPFLEGSVEEPLLLTRDADDQLHCISNVCTHRGTLVVNGPCVQPGLRCRYHGRKFGLDGRFKSMPEFDGAENFPSPADDLAPVAFEQWGPLLFASLDPRCSFADWFGDVTSRLGWLPLHEYRLDRSRSRDYLVDANWMLYCDNYLEGFHIPYVHPALNDALDYGSYRSELGEWANLQLGVARGSDDVFALPPESPDAAGGQAIGGYYYWLFPNLMLNFYPWGLSINVVKPLAVDRTRVSFITYVHDESRLDRGAGSGLDRVEREDEEVVELVQKGVRSRIYRRGRYSPKREQNVHHFHRLLARLAAE